MEMVEPLDVSDVRPSIPEVKKLPLLPLRRARIFFFFIKNLNFFCFQDTGYAFSQEDPKGFLDSYYIHAQN